ncbi:MAG: 2,3-bisphosphoglycerate-independent phosphoglycerate mutase [Candidatus Methanomethylicia archaeon]|jgi:2,3-bisphosphoglycerate-independent phosphoglycerate mutase|nr:2,3-bisphosphoglycerate-independent phosphoglycerate mutase [Candidatus Methanomethylicia archaeon]
MRFLIVVVDGMADRPISKLCGRTPLELADAENMNYLASIGSSGIMAPEKTNITLGSDLAVLSILGYDLEKYYTGRGPLEAAGAGVDMNKWDLAFRCNICEIGPGRTILNEKAELPKEEALRLEERIRVACSKGLKDVEILFKHTLGFRGVLLLRGKMLTLNIVTTQPKRFASIPDFVPLERTEEAKYTAEILSSFLKISEHESESGRKYAVLPWGGGTKTNLPKFSDRYGFEAAVVAGVPLIKGIGTLCGMSVVDVPGATGNFDTDLHGKAKAALETLREKDLVLLHIEATDELSHDGNLEGKIEMIKKVDRMLGEVLDNIALENTRIALLSDHTTSVELRSHTNDPVPVVIAGGSFPRDGIEEYSETAARRGGLGLFKAEEFMSKLLKHTKL